MVEFGWDLAALFSLVGALFYWGAQVLGVEALYRHACVLLAVAVVLSAGMALLGAW
jgi:hypothetical protein